MMVNTEQPTEMNNRIRNRYLQTIGIVVIVLSLVRCVFPRVAGNLSSSTSQQLTASADSTKVGTDSLGKADDSAAMTKAEAESLPYANTADTVKFPVLSTRYVPDGGKYHRIRSVISYSKAFPDSNHVQIVAATRWGVKPVKNRADAENRKNELVYIGSSPHYKLAKLDASIPYLVPRAALLLDDISRNFQDSLQVKGVPLYRLLVTSVLRSEEDVAKLRRSNPNATEQSCHLYGTTFDINYNLYSRVVDPDSGQREDIGDVRLIQVLSEVLNDLRQQGRCYVKFERSQPCFHITVR